MSEAIRIEGLAELRRDLKRMQPDTLKEVRGALKDAAGEVATAARPLAHRHTGRLAASYRAGTSGNAAVVRSSLRYAALQEFGGRIAPKGTPFRVKANPAVTRALGSNEERIVDQIGDAIDKVAARHGWS